MKMNLSYNNNYVAAFPLATLVTVPIRKKLLVSLYHVGLAKAGIMIYIAVYWSGHIIIIIIATIAITMYMYHFATVSTF